MNRYSVVLEIHAKDLPTVNEVLDQLEANASAFGVGVTTKSTTPLSKKERVPSVVEALRELTDLCEYVPVFQLDGGRGVKSVRLAGKFLAAMEKSKAVLARRS